MKSILCVTLTLLTFVTLVSVPKSFAQDTLHQYVVRQIYFHPSDRPPSRDMDARLDMLVENVQQFYADEMERHGFGRKTFRLETDALGKRVRHVVKGKFPAIDYSMNLIGKAHEEINEHFDLSEHFVHLIFIVGDDNSPASSQVGGNAGSHWFGGIANITLLDFHIAPKSLDLRAFNTIAHELGHAFGLSHDFRDERYIMSYGPEKLNDRLSYCAAEWLDAHRYFNTTQSSFDRGAAIEMLPPALVSPPNTVRLRFEITHSDGLHQAQLLTNSLAWSPSVDPILLDCKSLNTNSSTVEFVTTELAPASEYIVLSVIDVHGNFTSQEFPFDTDALFPDSEPVLIPDANLAAMIRESLGVAPGNPITKLDMLGLGRLDNHGASEPEAFVRDLTGLQHATNFEYLYLSHIHLDPDFNQTFGEIRDLTPLTELTQLRSLVLAGNKISDIGPLSGLTQLNYLNLHNNQIVNITPLTGLSNLTRLILPGNQITDEGLVLLTEFPNLVGLSLDSNQISDIAPLANLTGINDLTLSGNQISDITPLANLTGINFLGLSFNQIVDITPLTGLTELQVLNLESNQITDVTPFTKLTNLRLLVLQSNQISDVRPLTDLVNLEILSLIGNPIEDIAPLFELLRKNPGVKIWLDDDKPLSPPSSAIITFNPDSVADQTFEVDRTIQVLALPEATGGTTPYTYTLSPIPDGLAFDTTTRELNGTPTTLGTTEVTYTATDATDASASLTFTIEVRASLTLRPNTIADQTFVVNGSITPLVLPEATGGIAPYTYTLTPIPNGLVFDASTRTLSGIPTTPAPAMSVTYTATDATDISTSLTFTIMVEMNLDVNADGQVNVLDLVQVALFYGKRGTNLPEDVNANGVIDVTDLVAVANGIDAADDLSLAVEQGLLSALAEAAALQAIPEAPMGLDRHQRALSLRMTSDNVATALADAKHLAADDGHLGKAVAVLERLLALLMEIGTIPDQTALLPNYPNPFNPETWIPYHLATDAEVILTIYDVRGSVVRALSLGHQPAGVYQSKHRAAYWDGKNQIGEPVASSVYFYTLTVGEFTATRKLLIRK